LNFLIAPWPADCSLSTQNSHIVAIEEQGRLSAYANLSTIHLTKKNNTLVDKIKIEVQKQIKEK